RHDEHRNGLPNLLFHLVCAVNVDVQYDVAPRADILLNKRPRSPVELTVIFGPLQKLTSLHHFQKVRTLGKKVIDPIALSLTRLPRCVGYGELQIFKSLKKAL